MDNKMDKTPSRNFQVLANPARFMALSGALVGPLAIITIVLMLAGLYLSLYASPPDYKQGESVRIMYVHVPTAWLALLAYMVMAVSSATALIFRHPLADLCAKSAAPIGAAFTFVALVSGSLWGKPMWGAWWVWNDARLTSMLILLFLYLGYMALWAAIEEPVRAGRVAAVLALVGSVNVPIIHYSVVWWNTLHQPASVFRMDGPTIDPSMLRPLMVMALAFTFFFVTLLLMRMRVEILGRRIRALRLARAER